MGLLAKRLASDEARHHDWLNDDEEDEGYRTPAGVRVDRKAALGLTTVWRCVDLLASAVSQAPKDVIVKIGGRSFPEFRNRPRWLTVPDPTNLAYTANDYFHEVAVSLLLDGNFFVAVVPNIAEPDGLIVLDPRRVEVQPGPVYLIRNETGSVVDILRPFQMLHGTWLRPPEQLRGISPLEVLRRSLGSAIAAEDYAARFFGQGASLSFGVEVPYTLSDQDKADLREQLRRRHAGLARSHAIGILTNGAKFVTGLAPTPEQAQMLATRKFAVEDICRAFGVPPSLVGSQEPGASSYASAEVWDQQFKERAVLPLAVRIEAQHNRLLSVPEGINDPSASVQFKFNLDGVARTNLLTRYQAYGEGVTKGFLTPNEARVKEDLPPVPAGDRLYIQSQMVPIEQAATLGGKEAQDA